MLYILFSRNTEKYYYVGRTSNSLSNRLKEHKQNPTNEDMKKIFEEHDDIDIRRIYGFDSEYNAIEFFKTKHNLLNKAPGCKIPEDDEYNDLSEIELERIKNYEDSLKKKNSIKLSKTIQVNDDLPGMGKTEHMINSIISKPTERILYVVPTLILMNSIHDRLIQKGIPKEDISCVFTEDKRDDNTCTKQFIRTKSRIVIITHSFFQLFESSFNFDNIYIDEEILNSYGSFVFKTTSDISRNILNDIIFGFEIEPGVIKLVPKITGEQTDTVINSLKNNNTIIGKLLNKNFDFYTTKDKWLNYLNTKPGNDKNLEILYFFNFNNCRNSNNIFNYGFYISNSPLFQLLKVHHNINIHKVSTNLSYKDKIEIKYITERKIGNCLLKDREYTTSQIKDAFDNLTFDPKKTLVLDLNFSYKKEFKLSGDFIRPPVVCHGMNEDEWMDCDHVILLSYYKYNPVEYSLFKSFKIHHNQYRDTTFKMQFLARSFIRKNVGGGKLNVYVIDKPTAERIKQSLVGCDVSISRIESNYIPPKRFVSATPRKNKANVSIKEKSRMGYLRRKKREKGSISAAEENELASLILKMDKF